MAADVEATIPPDLMHPEAIHQVVGLIRTLHVRPSVKRQILARWALMVGTTVGPDLYRYVQGIQR